MALRSIDLMIGDWLKNVLFNEFEQVDYLEDNNINGHPTDWYEPIPLTPEILGKNGFKKQGFDGWLLEFGTYAESGHILWRTDYGEPHLLIESYSSKHGDFRSFGICYVHDLQHALKLCGIEKTIEL